MRALLTAVWMLAAGPAAGQSSERETFMVAGWNDACSVGVQELGYAALGEAIQGEPVRTRIGTLTIAAGSEIARSDWLVDWSGANTWRPLETQRALAELARAGYQQPGVTETIRSGRPGARPPCEETILSTGTFALRAPTDWPDSAWRWNQITYSPLGTCGLFIFTRSEAGRPFYRAILKRLYNPAALNLRAQAHLDESGLLYEAGDLPGALQEAGIAVQLRPQLAETHYQNAALLCISGRLDEAMASLAEALRLAPRLKASALRDPAFEDVSKLPRFQILTAPAP